MKKQVTIWAFVFFTALCGAQDVQWSQPSGPLVYQNPAFAGLLGRYSVAVSYRDQWNVLGQTYRTPLLAADFRTQKNPARNGLSIGGMVYNDNGANGTYKTSVGSAIVSYHVMVDKNKKFGGGIGYRFIQSTLFTDPHTWSSQYNGMKYDPTLPGESLNWGRKNFGSVGAGISYSFEESADAANTANNIRWMMGYSVDHLNRPDVGLFGTTDKLKIKHTLFMNAFLPGSGSVALKPVLFAGYQGKAWQVMGGAVLRFGLGEISRYTGIKQGSGIGIGLLYRSKDAIIPTLEYESGNFLAGISYDITLSQFTGANNARGGVEISLRLRAPSDYLYKDKDKPKKTRSSTREFILK